MLDQLLQAVLGAQVELVSTELIGGPDVEQGPMGTPGQVETGQGIGCLQAPSLLPNV